MASEAQRRLIVALDYGRLAPAYELARRLVGFAGMFKVSSQLFTAEGPKAVEKLASLGTGIFLDLKFHDIPNTVASAVVTAASLPGVCLLSLHALGGLAMMRGAAKALAGRRNRPKLLAVTVLTSLDAKELGHVGIAGKPGACALRLAKLAQEAALDGVVASAQETRAIRRACGRGFLIVVPGIRPAKRAAQDQSRVAPPAEAIRAGADYLVVGRPITAANDPRAAAESILQEIEQAVRSCV